MSSSEDCCGIEVRDADAGGAQIAQQAGDAGALALGVVIIGDLASILGEDEVVGRQRRRDRLNLVLQLERQAFAAEFLHQLGLVLDQDDLALVDDADPVRHLLGFVDVMGGEDDGDAGGLQRSHHFPHALAQLDVDAGGRLVEEQDLWLVRQRLCDHHAPLHAAGQREDLCVLLVPQRQVLQHLLDMGRVLRLAEQAAAEADGVPHRSRTRRCAVPAAPGQSSSVPRDSRR